MNLFCVQFHVAQGAPESAIHEPSRGDRLTTSPLSDADATAVENALHQDSVKLEGESCMKMCGVMWLRILGLIVLPIALPIFVLPILAEAQSGSAVGDSSGAVAPSPHTTGPAQLDLGYTRPTEDMKLKNYFFDAYGPYPILSAAVAAGIDQAYDSPPEWNQGAKGYGKRFVSDFGILGVSTTTRYALAEALREDTLYYRCTCKGFFPRLRHAVISTVISRRGEDGHRVFSIPALVAPYAGSMTAVYAWYPGRYNAMDGFRIGNYNLLTYVGANISLEFFYSGRRSWFNRMHLNNTHGALPAAQ
jgi:hypothetical protein